MSRASDCLCRIAFSGLLLLIAATSLNACDSTIIELLTGSSPQKELTSRILAISQRMQQAGDQLKRYNHAAAISLHREAMEHWLYVASQISVNKIAEENHQERISELIIQVSKDLGLIRRKLDSSNLALIHELIEACITRMALITGMINGQPRIISFLELELALYGARPFMEKPADYQKALAESQFTALLKRMLPELQSEAVPFADQLETTFQKLFKAADNDSGRISPEVRKAQQQLVNLFVGFKQNLLKTGYFNTDSRLNSGKKN